MTMKDVDIGMTCTCMTEDTGTALVKVLEYAKRQDEIALEKVKKKTATTPAITRESYLKALREDIEIIDLVMNEVKKVKICPQK